MSPILMRVDFFAYPSYSTNRQAIAWRFSARQSANKISIDLQGRQTAHAAPGNGREHGGRVRLSPQLP
jgi:hypothetical protein